MASEAVCPRTGWEEGSLTRSLVDQMPGWVMVVAPDMHVIMVNRALRELLGRPAAGMYIGDVWRRYGQVTGSEGPFVRGQTPLHAALRGETVSGIEASALRADGSRFYVLVSVVPLKDAAGQITAAVVIMTDITAQKQVQADRERLLAEVEGARQNLQTILDSLPEAVLVVDRERRVRMGNATVKRYLGRDVLGESVPALRESYEYSPLSAPEAPLEQALRGEVVSGVQATMRLADGRRLDVLESAAPLYGGDGEVDEIAVLLTDITPLRELDRAKDEFISIAAHDLRTPLTSIKGHAQILQRRAGDCTSQPEVRRSLKTIDEQVNRMSELINRLLDVSRIRLGRLELGREPVDLVSLARQVTDDLRVTTDRHELVLATDLPELVGQWDATALGQVLANLVGNAIRHTPGGRVTVRIARLGGLARVDVTDQGPGIPAERQAHLFEAFAPGVAEEYRRAGGLGLGLYIARGIVEGYGGRIWLESVPGAGTTVSFVLPV